VDWSWVSEFQISSTFYFHVWIQFSFMVDIDETCLLVTDKDLIKLLAKHSWKCRFVQSLKQWNTMPRTYAFLKVQLQYKITARQSDFSEVIWCRVCQNAVMYIRRTEAWKLVMKLLYLTPVFVKLFPSQPRIRRTFWTIIWRSNLLCELSWKCEKREYAYKYELM
jgi:hypothetical protein